ncbi:hypothetical protein E2C01_004897 [Portunus trituberculatus]|uniref:SPRY domain-containing protein n=1 Tax=Portunus trituberculatus TaxID=210409 RepID=A0A5B7CSV4_PORTR|nr:hypothetical protein [Portunus trituberculatus]
MSLKHTKNHLGVTESYGRRTHIGDIVGVMLDLHDKTIILPQGYIGLLGVQTANPALCFRPEEKCHANVVDTYGHKWQVGDVVGVCLDLVDRTISEWLETDPRWLSGL